LCPEGFDFQEGALDIAFGQLPILGEAADRQSSEIIMYVCGAAFIAQVIRQDAQAPFPFAPG
jgi:hypothetical protein